jgi:chromosome segregation protein
MGRTGAAGAEVLRRKRELTELKARLAVVQKDEDAFSEARVAARNALDEVEGRRTVLETALRDARRKSGELDVELGAVRRRLADQKRLSEREQGRAYRLAEELERLAKEVITEEQNRKTADEQGVALSTEAERVEVELQAEQLELRTQTAQVEERKSVLAEINARLAGLRERHAGLERAATAAASAGEAAERLLKEIAADKDRVRQRLSTIANDLDRLAMELTNIEAQRDAVDAELKGHLEVQAAGRKEAEGVERTVQAARDAREVASKRLAELQQALVLVKESIRQIRQTVEERYEMSVSGLLDRVERDGSVTLRADWEPVETEAADTTPPEDLRITRGMLDDEEVIESWTAEVEQAKKSLARLGAVNLIALKEYEEVTVAHRDLEAQRADLERSVRAIRRTLAQLNRVSRERFRETYERVDQIFQEMYPRLVGGGKARLGLTNEDDLLETGVEVFVQPPGKRSQVLTLLSGGETAMVAIALIFSLFRVKPSPFCLLDEVDAPLDEVNGARFNTVLNEMSDLSQFIVITHNKKTMEAVDTLYGVTMTSPGVSRLVSVALNSDQPGSTPSGR